ncbi:MAG TPA: NRDE family protein [Candidatus Angelobacter sp.]|jgi:uncharacterized protein with NRDE domain|nr:NRDE family protein [Candidatus Angelobacter sp.]
MCTILLAWRVVPGAPIVLAANRDELLDRPSLPPLVLSEQPLVAGGQDALAGGTWLAVRADGAVAAVTNRRSEFRDPQRRSRGELPLALLRTAGDAEAHALLDRIAAHDYNPFNALYVSPEHAVVAEAHGDALRIRALDPGLHLLTVFDLDDRSQRKVDVLTARFERALAASPDDAHALLDAMEEILRDHGEPGRDGVDAACVHLDRYGTVSSSSVVVAEGGAITYRHAPGKPCVTPHDDCSALLAQPSAGSG